MYWYLVFFGRAPHLASFDDLVNTVMNDPSNEDEHRHQKCKAFAPNVGADVADARCRARPAAAAEIAVENVKLNPEPKRYEKHRNDDEFAHAILCSV